VRSVDPGIKRSPWSPEEDDRLRKAVAAFKNSWIDVADVLSGRTNDQCRERWGEISADRGWKGDWSPEEDQMLLDLAKQLGNKWCKNRYWKNWTSCEFFFGSFFLINQFGLFL